MLLLGTSLWAQPSKPAPKPAPKPAAPPTRKPAAPAKPSAPVTPPPAAAPQPQDFIVVTRHETGGTATTSTVYRKGARQRIDYGAELAVITPCDGGPTIQIDPKRQRYVVAARKPDGAAAPDNDDKPPAGRVTYTTTVTDTGERKVMFGLNARHVKLTLVKAPGAGACDKRQEQIETDGWFVDPPAGLACAVERRPVVAETADCRDTIEYAGADAASAGYPLAYTVTTTGSDGKSTAMSMSATSFDRQTLPDTLFSPPAGYTQVRTLAALTSDSADATAKVGVMRLTAKAEGVPELRALSEALVVSLGEAGVDAVMLDAGTPGAAFNEAGTRLLDYVLVTQITEVRRPSRGLLGRVTGSRDYGARVEYLLTKPGAPTARLSGSDRSGASALQSAVTAARSISRFITPFGLLSSRFTFMNALSAPGSDPAMAQSPDPVMNTVFSLLDTVPATRAPQDAPQSEEAAVAAALERQVASIAGALLETK